MSIMLHYIEGESIELKAQEKVPKLGIVNINPLRV